MVLSMNKIRAWLKTIVSRKNSPVKYYWLAGLAIITVISLNLIYASPAISNAGSKSLTPKQLGKIINRTEKSWEYDYEDYFQRDFTNYSQSEKQISQQLLKLSQSTNTKPAVMWAVPTSKQLYLLLITPGENPVIKTVRSARGKALSLAIRNFYYNIHKSRRLNSKSYLSSSKLLYKWLIKPLEPELKAANIDTLMFCSGTGLRSFPVAALYDGEQFLIEKYSLVRLPALNLTDISYAPDKNKQMTVLAMGASEFENMPPLPGVEIEVPLITPQTLPGKGILNQDFTVKNLRQQHKKNSYDLIHLATHGEFRSGSAANSYIQFGNEKVGLDRIDQLGLNDPPVDLLVLSACKTALGNKQAEFGFAGLALQAGAKSTLASLWSIDDAGTVALMSEFYQNLKSGLMKAQALRESQIAMLKGKVYLKDGQLQSVRRAVSIPTSLNTQHRDNLSHPYYWAGFSLIGSPW